MSSTPILYLIYNRPSLVKKSFEAIKKYKPKILFVAADGPKNEEDAILTEECRAYILNNVCWDCKLKTLFRDSNMGCGKGVSSAISWFFKNVEEGVILEDDIIPSQSFFPFCHLLLEKYKREKNVFSITGVNWQCGIIRGKSSYYFSKYPSIWGWATWRDRWSNYDYKMTGLSNYINSKNINKIAFTKKESEYHLNSFKAALNIDTWDYQWKYTMFTNNAYSIVPNTNMIKNIGFGSSATHTTEENWKSNREIHEIDNVLWHPNKIERHVEADLFFSKNILFNKEPSFLKKFFAKISKVIIPNE